MVMTGAAVNVSTIADLFPVELTSRLEFLITLIQTASIIFIIYVGFWIIEAVIGLKRNKEIKELIENTRKMNANLEKLVAIKRSKK